ncbi:tail fiber domain-containing protein [Candidatus Woesearchaeota archaeon]|nr:tail fiber domain-containing protein [Candidatus Woesearchaeota archaeon]
MLNIKNGNVSIGTTSPDAKLTVQSGVTGSGLHIRAGENEPDYIMKVEDQDGSVQAMYITTDGKVGMGTTTPNAPLHINTSRAVPNSCGGNWLNDASAIMFRQNPGGGCGDDAYIAYYTTASDKTVLEIAARNDGPPIQDDIALMPGGGVGIGMTNPSTALHIAENNQEAELIIGSQLSTTYGSRAGIQVGNTDDHSSVMLGQSASNFVNLVWVYNAIPANAYAALGTMGGNNLILQNVAGNVGIGTNPDAKLTIQSAATGSGLHIRAGENEPDYIMKVEDQDGSVQAMYITTNGNLGIGTTSPGNILSVVQNSATDPIADSWTVYSSRDYKTNITALSDEELAEILGKAVETKLYRYTFRNDSTGKVKLGIIAEEAPAQILAEGGKAESVNEYVAFLHAAIKAQHKEMEDLKTANEELKQRVTRLEEKG